MAPPAIIPMRPVPIEQMFGDMRLDLAFRSSVDASLVTGIVLAIRKNARSERQRFAVRGPQEIIHAAGDVGYARRLTALDRYEIDL